MPELVEEKRGGRYSQEGIVKPVRFELGRTVVGRQRGGSSTAEDEGNIFT